MMPDPLSVDDGVIQPIEPTPEPVEAVAQTITIADALQSSRQAHAMYTQLSPRMAAVAGSTPVLQQGDARGALDALKKAAAARAYAELLDPLHQDPAWAEDGRTHPAQETLVFYLQVLSR
jgi:hypothetical protein